MLNAVTFAYSNQSQPVPSLPSPLPVLDSGETEFETGAADGSSTRFRVLVQPFDQLGRVLVVAIPLTDVQQTLSRLVVIEGVVTIVVLAGLAAVAWWLDPPRPAAPG